MRFVIGRTSTKLPSRLRWSVAHSAERLEQAASSSTLGHADAAACGAPNEQRLEDEALAYLAYEIMAPVMPITFFIAIQRYHLYEIDRLINKALVYGSLSAILALVFVGGVLGLQTAVRTTTGQDSPVALVASTLLIAALFQPLRSRIQNTIDRRFYRAKYDAQKALATFNATLQQEVSLNELQEQLVGIVNETLQPAHVSLWIAPRP